jgi:hypothetical protein
MRQNRCRDKNACDGSLIEAGPGDGRDRVLSRRPWGLATEPVDAVSAHWGRRGVQELVQEQPFPRQSLLARRLAKNMG